MSALLETQKAIYAALNDDATLSSLVEGVFNHVPRGTAYPYVVIQRGSAEEIANISTHKEQLRFTFSIYSDADGAKEGLDIAAEIHRILHQQSLTLAAGYILEMLLVKQTDVRRLASGQLWLTEVDIVARVSVE